MRNGTSRPERIEDALLVVAELVANAIEVCPGRLIVLEADLLPDAPMIGLWDPSPCLPVPRRPAEDDTGGRGLMIIEALCEVWGTRHPSGGGKTVWCRLALPARP